MHSSSLRNKHLKSTWVMHTLTSTEEKVMARVKSIIGRHYPVKEYHINAKAKPGENPIYEGPDRAAVEMFKELGVEYLGQDAGSNEDMLLKIRGLGYKTIDSYLKATKGKSYAELKKEAEAELESKVYLDEEEQKRKPQLNIRSGGDVTGQGTSMRGGIGDPTNLPGIDLNARA